MNNFKNMVNEEFNLKISNTLAGTSQTIFLKRFCEHKLTGLNTDEILLEAYYGGRCEVFTIGKINKIACVDINSSYPYSMLQLIPYGEYYTSKFPQEKFYIAHVKLHIKEESQD